MNSGPGGQHSNSKVLFIRIGVTGLALYGCLNWSLTMASGACEKAVVLELLAQPVKAQAVIWDFALLAEEEPAELVALGPQSLQLDAQGLLDIQGIICLRLVALAGSVGFLV